MKSRRASGDRVSRSRPTAKPAADPAPALPLTHPALLVAAVVAFACIALAVSAYIYDTDLWQHLVGGKAIWSRHAVPTRQEWAWPTYGNQEWNAAWLFRVLVWPFWDRGEVAGLFVWRWLSTLTAFGILWATARRMGARGLTPLLVLVVCALTYRQRSQIRPETLASILLATELWILETWRGGGRDRTPWLVMVAWAWANAHVSYYMGLVVMAVYVMDGLITRRAVRKLALIGIACAAISFVNPLGWHALWEPFAYGLYFKGEAVYRSIGELQPLDWANNARNGLAIVVVLWPVLALWRWRRHGLDIAEVVLCICITALMLRTQRFTGTYAIIAAPFLARDLDAWIGSRRWAEWTRGAWARGGMTAAACMLAAVPDLLRVELPLGVAINWSRYPIAACDFMAAHGVRGRGFNNFDLGPYQTWRFWPERDRLPFMSAIPEAADPQDRNLAVLAARDRRAWAELDGKHHFDYALLNRIEYGDMLLLNHLDADRDWALVFADDAAVVYVRRQGPLAAVADSFAYRLLPGGTAGIVPLGVRMANDPTVAAAAHAELLRQFNASRWNAAAASLLAREAMSNGRRDEARRWTERAISASPLMPGEHERLGDLALAEGRAAEALAEFKRERHLRISEAGLEARFGDAYAALDDRGQARRWYQRALRRDPSDARASAGMAALGG